LATADDEIDLSVGSLECTIGVAPFRQWWWSMFFSIVVVTVVVVLATSVIASVIPVIIALVVTAIIPMVATPVIAVIVTIVITSVVVAVVAVIITSIPIVIATVGPAITIITSIRLMVTVVEGLVTIPFVAVPAPGLLRGRWDPKSTLQLLTLPHGMLSVVVKLALVVQDHVEVTFEEGGRPWWICHVGFARSLVRPVPSVIVVFTIEVVHHRVLSVDQLVDVC
jgi:hypothetical protein